MPGVTEELNLSLYLILIEITIVGSSYHLGQPASAVITIDGICQGSRDDTAKP